jgi:RNA polymerase sigma-70 factor (ECF subfamily)
VTDRPDVRAAIEEAHRSEWGRVLAATARFTRDIDLAEDCVEDAYVSALRAWQADGVPANPGAWLTTTARRRALDIFRRQQTLQNKYQLIVEPVAEEEPVMVDMDEIPDDRLRLIFTCCHPALAQDAQVALTLRLLCGLTTSEIARMFLTPLPTIAARITRAKKKIAAARIPYRVPSAADLPERLSPVLAVIYLIYSAGHTSPEGENLDNPELVARALELGRALVSLMPDEREARGLLALILLTESRRAGRTSDSGDLVLLEDQDRSSWNQAMIADGVRLVEQSLVAGRPGRYAVQAAIAAVHAEAKTWESTDWRQIVLLYDVLLAIWPSPVVALNRIAALAMERGYELALAELAELETDERLGGYVYLPAVKADLLRRSGRLDEAGDAYRRALELAGNSRERAYLMGRLDEVTD